MAPKLLGFVPPQTSGAAACTPGPSCRAHRPLEAACELQGWKCAPGCARLPGSGAQSILGPISLVHPGFRVDSNCRPSVLEMSLLLFPWSSLLASLTSIGYGQAPRGKAVSALPPAQQGHQYHWSGESGRCAGQRPWDVTWEGLSEVSRAGDLAEVTCPQPQLPRVCSAMGLLLLAGSTQEDPSSAVRKWGPGRGVLPPRPHGTACAVQPHPP